MKGEVGPEGKLGKKGDRGEPGPAGEVPASKIALLKVRFCLGIFFVLNLNSKYFLMIQA